MLRVNISDPIETGADAGSWAMTAHYGIETEALRLETNPSNRDQCFCHYRVIDGPGMQVEFVVEDVQGG